MKDEEKKRFFIGKWYFWLTVIVYWIITIPKSSRTLMEFLGTFVGSLIFIFLIYLIIWGIIKGFEKFGKRKGF